ncbi:MAG: methionine--tRNA ligase [Candidatus Campbellbacteria bacterium]|nr:methionine--tRNA ligase [Candidatus Campbellbacteria bacterium]
MRGNYYITTTLPYVNSEPHLGHALEFVQADMLARVHSSLGYDVFFNIGTDEHGTKVYKKAQDVGEDVKDYVRNTSNLFKDLAETLSVVPTRFIRTTDKDHIEAAQEFWRRCDKNGYIYKKSYEGKYCVGCELFKQDDEIVGGVCPLHPTTPIESLSEENYFFAFSKFSEQLAKLYKENKDFVFPTQRQKEIEKFLERGLKDFSISRDKNRLPWGVPTPNDETQVMYVWFDALVNYLTTIGWPDDSHKKWWPVVQIAGKDNLRQQSAMWQAMLLSVSMQPSKQIYIHGFITKDGKKMSKSLGNVISPYEIISHYGADFLRYFLLAHINPYEDSDVDWTRLHNVYTADFSNGIGNLVSRIMRLSSEHIAEKIDIPSKEFPEEVVKSCKKYDFNEAVTWYTDNMRGLDEMIQKKRPFETITKDKEKGVEEIKALVRQLYFIIDAFEPILPDTSKKVKDLIKENKFPQKPLFERKDIYVG